jgi:hypothetical protein
VPACGQDVAGAQSIVARQFINNFISARSDRTEQSWPSQDEMAPLPLVPSDPSRGDNPDLKARQLYDKKKN